MEPAVPRRQTSTGASERRNSTAQDQGSQSAYRVPRTKAESGDLQDVLEKVNNFYIRAYTNFNLTHIWLEIGVLEIKSGKWDRRASSGCDGDGG